MRVNTSTSMRLARRVKSRYGTWQAVRQASRVENDEHLAFVPLHSPLGFVIEPSTQWQLTPCR